MTSLRERLKAGTAESHNRIDRRMGALDLTTVGGLSKFLGAHYLVQSLYEGSLPGFEATGMVSHLENDLESLGTDLPRWKNAPDVADEDPLGYRYVVTGSQLGARLLYKDWSAATDSNVLAASRYLTTNMKSRAWRDLVAEMKSLDLSNKEVKAAVASANRVFLRFGEAATLMGVPEAS